MKLWSLKGCLTLGKYTSHPSITVSHSHTGTRMVLNGVVMYQSTGMMKEVRKANPLCPGVRAETLFWNAILPRRKRYSESQSWNAILKRQNAILKGILSRNPETLFAIPNEIAVANQPWAGDARLLNANQTTLKFTENQGKSQPLTTSLYPSRIEPNFIIYLIPRQK